jgi:hypothetical protein
MTQWKKTFQTGCFKKTEFIDKEMTRNFSHDKNSVDRAFSAVSPLHQRTKQ